MNPGTIRILLILFLLAHGYIHMSLTQVPVPQPGALHTPFMPSWWRAAVDPTWPASKLGLPENAVRTMGWLLWLSVTVLFTLAALALLFSPAQSALWQGLAAAASILSLALLGLYWHPWYPVGAAIDVALLVAILTHLPAIQFAKPLASL